MKKNLNQKLISLIEYYNLIGANFSLSDNPLKRKNNNTVIFKIRKKQICDERSL